MALDVPRTTLGEIRDRLQLGELIGDPATPVEDVAIDSRLVRAGSLFCAVPGQVTDGRRFVAEARAAGADALLVEAEPVDSELPQLVVPVGEGRRSAALAACELLGDPSHRIEVVGITGTNGKTTVAHVLGHLLRVGGFEVRVIGTLTGERTTPEAPELQRAFAELAGIAESSGRSGAVVVEVSSHALVLQRVEGTRFALGLFTNLSRDHLDFHGTMGEYLAAKAQLFAPGRAQRGIYLTDDDAGARIAAGTTTPMDPVSTDALEGLSLELGATSFTWRGQRVRSRLTGRFNAANLLLAAEAAVALGLAPELVAEALGSCPPVPGRFEIVEGHPGQPVVVVDYAHTPAGVSGALSAVAELVPGRLAVVLGAGGGRDEGKRAEMARAALEHADVVVVTADNPRHEDPAAIAEQMLADVGQDERAAKVIVELDRAEAIARAIEAAGPSGVVAVLGKGHEAYQEVGDERRPFDDRLVAAELLGASGRAG